MISGYLSEATNSFYNISNEQDSWNISIPKESGWSGEDNGGRNEQTISSFSFTLDWNIWLVKNSECVCPPLRSGLIHHSTVNEGGALLLAKTKTLTDRVLVWEVFICTCTVQQRAKSHDGVQHVCGSQTWGAIQGHVPGECSSSSPPISLFYLFQCQAIKSDAAAWVTIRATWTKLHAYICNHHVDTLT